jgi:ectoine hydroxylase-related dioxygenase (phytanoyl-CoA dioxygenase family)
MNSVADIAQHAAQVIERGYTIIPAQVSPRHIAALNAAADRALEKVSRVAAAGVRMAHTQVNSHVRSARCFYTWDASSRELLEHETVHALGKLVLGQPRLWEMTVLEALPMPADADLGPFGWHRDFSVEAADGLQQAYMWVFTCLTDVTSDNGATWVVPGSHRDPSLRPPGAGDAAGRGNAVQLTARAGDMVVINPVMLHRVGENRTQSGRRLALVGLCRMDRSPLLNHWLIGGAKLRQGASQAVLDLLQTDDWALDVSWDVMPDDWLGDRPRLLHSAMRGLVRTRNAMLTAPQRVGRKLGALAARGP